ncbi:MAG TPA: ABC transporter substrate-binding protein [Stellaceae bacterium]|jgi:ABC-type nitrate/sulfonate/bicarbonate transport system substrate-binding protein
MEQRVYAAALALAAMVLTGPGARADTTIRLGQVPSTMKSIGIVPYVIADQQGFFADEHLAVQLVPLEGGTDQMVKRLDAGDVEISSSATPYFIQAVAEGRSQDVAVAAATANPIYSLMVRPGVKSFADLKGKTLGLSLGIDTISISMRKLLTQKGLKDSDYRVKELVGTPVRFDCLKRGECDGVPLGQPEDFTAIDQGFTRLGVSTDAVKHFEFTALIVRPDWAKQNRPALVGFLRGFAASLKYFRDAAHRNDVVKTIVATTGVTDKIARETLKLYFEPDRGVIPRAGELDLKGLAQVIAFMGEAGVLKDPLPKPERFVDRSYLRAAGVR